MLRSLVRTIYLRSILNQQVQRLRLQARDLFTSQKNTIEDAQTESVSNSTEDTNVHRGTAYEKTAEQVLAQLGIGVARCGGAGDRGIDLRGWWTLRPSINENNTIPSTYQQLPHQPNESNDTVTRIRVICQCKRLRGKLSPGPIRELAGVALREQVMGILLSAKGFSQQAIREWRCSIAPLVLVDLPADSDHCTAIRWNDMAARQLRGLVVGRPAVKSLASPGVTLYLHGMPIAPVSSSSLDIIL